MVGQDDVADGPVALHLPHDFRTLIRVHADDLPILLGELRVVLEDPVGEDELSDVVEQPGRVHQLLVLLREPGRDRDLARVTRDGRAVARSHAVSQIERVHDCAQHPDLKARELLRPCAELVALCRQLFRPLLRQQQLAEKILEGEEHKTEERDGRDPHADVEIGDPDREKRGGELGG